MGAPPTYLGEADLLKGVSHLLQPLLYVSAFGSAGADGLPYALGALPHAVATAQRLLPCDLSRCNICRR